MKRIERIINIVNSDESKASTHMIICRDDYDEEMNIMKNLISYEVEYKKNYEITSKNGMPIETINNYNSFMARLKLTVTQQKIKVGESKEIMNVAIVDWKSKLRERQSLENLNVKLDNHLLIESNRNEQKEQDEIGSNSFRRNKGV